MGKRRRGGGHGGAWKVAYADFVTAMMALFLVLWIVAQDDEILIHTSEYFKNPFNSPLEQSTGVMPNVLPGGQTPRADDQEVKASLLDLNFLHALARELYRLLDIQENELEKSAVDIAVTHDGLRITVFSRTDHPVFQGQSAKLTEWGQFVLKNLSWIVDRYEFDVRIDAFTFDSTESPAGASDIDPWTLTAEQALAARDAMVYYALDPEKIDRVTGFGDRHPIKGSQRDEPENQRLEISLSAN